MANKISRSAYVSIGLMLFALFFGAGNLIFPASLGQNAGSNFPEAILGFLITGVGLPLLGVIAVGISGNKDLQDLASRVHPVFGLVFTLLLYLTIGPGFAIPRTGTVSYEIGIRPFLGAGAGNMELAAFLAVFFVISWWFSISPNKLVDRIGRTLTPLLLLMLAVLVAKSLVTPIGLPQPPTDAYATSSVALAQGFLDGYNTMDALASIVFGFLIIKAVRQYGAEFESDIANATFRSGLIAAVCLGVVYIFIANIGATSVSGIGLQETGAPVLSLSTQYYFGAPGAVILAIIVLLACLTTSIGLITSCASYFTELIPQLSHRAWVTVFAAVSFFIGMFGLSTIISAAIPVLMFLYPLTMVLIALTFLAPLFHNRQAVFLTTMLFTMIPALYDGLRTAGFELETATQWMEGNLPLFGFGLGWVSFSVIGFILGWVYTAVVKK
ncbi:MAG: branched-chain amino acid transport system II carrier protein [Veillonellaceae bacterium]|nr:branched-chain amino acid transport system II carrier protein [Veillonellaceae bacterium]